MQGRWVGMDSSAEQKKRHQNEIRKRKKDEREHRINDILECAKEVFYSKGYLKATMDEIALKARISKPTIYYYFKSKDVLFFSLILPVFENIHKELGRIEESLASSRYEDGAALAKDLFDSYYRIYLEFPMRFRIVQLSLQTGLTWKLDGAVREDLYERARNNFRLLRKIMSAAMEKGHFRKTNPYGLADLLWGQIVGIIQLEDVKSNHKADNKHLQPTLALAADVFIEGIAAR
jgi:AcrR family transcriptional regulator